MHKTLRNINFTPLVTNSWQLAV